MRIALVGLGHVGAAVLRILKTHAEELKNRCGQEIKVVGVSARDKNKNRSCDLSNIEWVDDPLLLTTRKDVDVVIELIGGAQGRALEIAQSALHHGKHFVTANKALMATHGVSLARLAEKKSLQLSFEAAVCGGLPVLQLLREGMAANHLISLRGVLNGTCNYILTRMHDEGIDFDTALGEVQERGYAEKDPSYDIDGTDSAYKLALLSALAFGTLPDFEAVFTEGIRHLSQSDLRDAASKGGRIKLIGVSNRSSSGIVQRVQPIFVRQNEALAHIEGAANAIEIAGDFVGTLLLQGIGAGGDATASAVVADLLNIARGNRSFAFGLAADKLKK
jgi:homoserine dehydrogenase